MSQPFETLRERLLTDGIAPRHVRRYIGELNDHFADLKAAGASDAEAMQRLGGVDELARVMTERHELRSWTARAPWATLVLAPPMGLAGVIIASIFLLVGAAKLFPPPSDPTWIPPGWMQSSANAITTFEIYILPILFGWGLAALAVRRRLSLLWPVIGMAVLAVVAGGAEFHVISRPPGGHGEVQAGFGYSIPQFFTRGLINFMLTAGPYLAVRARLRRAAARS